MRAFSIALVTFSLFGLTACSRSDDSEKLTVSPSGASSTGWPLTSPTEGGNFEVKVQKDGGEIERNKHFSLDVTVAAKSGELGDVKVVVDADMPAHRHGMNTKPETSAKGTGQYRVDGMVFHMSGDWVITVDVTRGSDTERASFPVSIE